MTPDERGAAHPSSRPHNLWHRTLEHRESVPTAVSLFVAYVAGTLLMMAGMMMALAGLLLVTGTTARSAGGRATGLVIVVIAAGLLVGGRWLAVQFRVSGRTYRG